MIKKLSIIILIIISNITICSHDVLGGYIEIPETLLSPPKSSSSPLKKITVPQTHVSEEQAFSFDKPLPESENLRYFIRILSTPDFLNKLNPKLKFITLFLNKDPFIKSLLKQAGSPTYFKGIFERRKKNILSYPPPVKFNILSSSDKKILSLFKENFPPTPVSTILEVDCYINFIGFDTAIEKFLTTSASYRLSYDKRMKLKYVLLPFIKLINFALLKFILKPDELSINFYLNSKNKLTVSRHFKKPFEITKFIPSDTILYFIKRENPDLRFNQSVMANPGSMKQLEELAKMYEINIEKEVFPLMSSDTLITLFLDSNNMLTFNICLSLKKSNNLIKVARKLQNFFNQLGIKIEKTPLKNIYKITFLLFRNFPLFARKYESYLLISNSLSYISGININNKNENLEKFKTHFFKNLTSIFKININKINAALKALNKLSLPFKPSKKITKLKNIPLLNSFKTMTFIGGINTDGFRIKLYLNW